MTPPWLSLLASAVLRGYPKSEKLMAFLWEAYLDESETDEQENGGGRAYSVSCLIAPSFQWERFSLAWADAMKCGGAEGKILHMKNLLHGTSDGTPEGDFTSWKGKEAEHRKRELFQKLITVVQSFPILSYCGSIPLADYEELYAVTDEKDGPITPYQLVLHGTMEAIIEGSTVASSLIRPSSNNPIVFFMEQNQMLQADLMHQFFALVKFRGWDDIFRTIVPIPKGPEPLQVADMVVYEGSTYSSRHVVGSSKRKERTLYTLLKNTPGVVFTTAPRQLLVDHISDLINKRNTVTPEEAAGANARYEQARKRMQRELNPGYRKRKTKKGQNS